MNKYYACKHKNTQTLKLKYKEEEEEEEDTIQMSFIICQQHTVA